MKLSIVYFTDGHVPERVREFCLSRLKAQAKAGKHQLIEIRQQPEAPRCHASIYKNIITGIEQAKHKYIAIAEHDCMYSDDYWDGVGKDEVSYLINVVYLTEKGFANRDIEGAPLSTLAGEKKTILGLVRKKIKEGEKPKVAEPGIDSASFRAAGWVIDIRHGMNFTGSRDGFIAEYFAKHEEFDAKELWDNLFKPIKKPVIAKSLPVTVIIPSRVERLLKWTIENVKRTAPGAEIIVVHDGWTSNIQNMEGVKEMVPVVTPQGVGQSREFGLMQASNDICILIDAHMDFMPGWVECMADIVANDNKSIVSTMSAVLREDRMDINNPEKIQGGARINFESEVPLDPQWLQYKPGEIPCILGGAYALSKEWYFGGLHRPWANAFGWGSSEQVISLANWFCGGRNILADCLTAHLYRRAVEVIETRFTPMTRAGMWYNRLRLIDLLPVPLEKKAGLVHMVQERIEYRQHSAFINELLKGRPHVNDNAIKNAMAATGRTMEEYEAEWYPSGIRWPAARPPKQPAVMSPAPRSSGSQYIQDRPSRRFV